MGLASQQEIDNAVIQAKKKLQDEEVVDVLKGCSYGGKAIGMAMKRPLDCMGISMKGGDLKNGKTD